MPRARTIRISEFKARLLARLDDGFHRPGQRFLSTRAIAAKYDVSFQTAHRIVGELVDEGRLIRRAGSGTFIAGQPAALQRVLLVFHSRAKRADSFGAHLRTRMAEALSRAGLEHGTTYSEGPVRAPTDAYPVFWENPAAAHALAACGRYVLLLNDAPPPGIAGSFIDSVSTDNFSGGLCAAEVLGETTQKRGHITVIAGPREDLRSQQRVDGFRSHCPDARVLWANSWDYGAGEAAARRLPGTTGACFCVNDRLAGGLLANLAKRRRTMPVVGFDDAPLAEPLGLTTIAIPWESLVAGAVAIIERRLAGDTTNGRQQIFAPRPVLRRSHQLPVEIR